MYLGISAYYHDSSVCLLDNNLNLLDFKKEEWLSRVKGDNSFPRLALKEIIKNHSLSNKNIKNICFYEKPLRSWLTVIKHSVKINKMNNDLTRNYYKNIWKSSIIFRYDISKFKELNKIPIYYLEHHMSHTLSALYYNEYPCVSIVVDGFGDQFCTSIHHVLKENNIKELWTSEYPHSIGLFYSAITDYLGFAVNEGEYKVMGFAAFGKPIYYEELQKTIKIEEDKLILDTEYYDFVRSTKNSYSLKLQEIFKIPPRESHLPLEIGDKDFNDYANIAASAQKVTEKLLEKLMELAHKLSGEKKFLLSGGVAMNSSALRKLAKLEFVDEINVPPSPGDSGACIGAAYFGYIKDNSNAINQNKKNTLRSKLYPGLSKSNDDFYENILKKIADKNNIIDKAVELIENNEIIATCYDNIETGPRALGNRSLICNGHNQNLVSKLSVQIKNRSPFRPTAPAILEEDASRYFKIEKSLLKNYLHMGSTTMTIQDQIEEIRGVVHVDNSARIQICDKEQLLGKILHKCRKNNIFILANTSFNISSDPMVYDKEDALLAIKRMNIKFLLTETGVYSTQ